MADSEHQVLGLQRPSIEPITFPCRADALNVIPRTRVHLKYIRFKINITLLHFNTKQITIQFKTKHILTYAKV